MAERMTVIIAPLAGDSKSLRLARGTTLRRALLLAGYEESELKGMLGGIRVNNQRKSLDSKLLPGAFITVAQDVQGG